MIIAVDFDGTIVEHRYPEIGKELPFAIETLKRLQEDRHKLILWTAREGRLLDEAVEFCRARGLEFYAVNTDMPGANWEDCSVARKLRCDLFIDDRNIGGLPEWPVIYEMISRGLNFGDMLEKASSGEDIFEDDGAVEEGFWARFLVALRGRHPSRSGRHSSRGRHPSRSSRSSVSRRRGSHHW